MKKLIDLTGKQFGKLTVIKMIKINNRTYWKCKCECGNETVCRDDSLKVGHSLSCGCNKIGKNSKQFKHGKGNTRLYRIWSLMRCRCYNKNNKLYKYYGERGISICDEWTDKENGFINFYNWAMANGYTDELTIDRINVDGNYEPLNCRWVTMAVQCNNKRNNVIFDINGEKLNIAQISRRYNLNRTVIEGRLNRNWSITEVINGHKDNKLYLVNGEKLTIMELSKKYNILYTTVLNRIHRGWAVEKAVLTPVNIKHRRKNKEN